MRIVDKRDRTPKQEFVSLKIGQAYIDFNGYICIKTSNEFGEEYNNCIYWHPTLKEWISNEENKNAMVEPLETELLIL